MTFLLLFGMMGCKNVQPSDLTGTWVATNESRTGWPPEFQKASAKIVVNGDGSFVASVALRLGKYFGMTAQFWMSLQTDYDLRLAALRAPLSKIKPRSAASPITAGNGQLTSRATRNP